MIFLFLSSGLFLGWSLGANDAANIFGTAVGTKMVKFKVAALIASVFVILGAFISGAGASHTLGELGSINKLPGSFTVAMAAAFTVTFMTRLKLPVSTSQAVVGAILGWNFFSGSPTNFASLTKIITTWILCPILAAFFSALLYKLTKLLFLKSSIHLLRMDAYTRMALILVGAFGSYSLGANNIANVMGVFIHSVPFRDIHINSIITISSIQQLFFIGGLAISLGIYTYSKRVMNTVGKDLFRLSPVTAFIVVLSHSLVLYIFASQGLRNFLVSLSLPPIPLVPVSSSQAVIGAILGIALVKGGKNIKFSVLGKISSGWVTTPVIACLISILFLFFMKNVFDQQVYQKNIYTFREPVIEKMREYDFDEEKINFLYDVQFQNTNSILNYLESIGITDEKEIEILLQYSLEFPIKIHRAYFGHLDTSVFSLNQLQAVKLLMDETFDYKWRFHKKLINHSDEWAFREGKEFYQHNKEISAKLDYLAEFFRKK